MFNTAPFVWAVSHFAYVGWTSLVYACYRIIIACFKIGRAASLVEQRVLKGEETLHLVATNHLPHLLSAIEDVGSKTGETNRILDSMREDFRVIKHLQLNRVETAGMREYLESDK